MIKATRKSLLKYFGEEKGKRIHDVIVGTLSPMQFESVRNWTRQCYNEPSDDEQILEAINEILGFHGTEAVTSETFWKAYFCNVRFSYCNSGDTYGTTVLFDSEREDYFIGDLEEMVLESEKE